MKKKILGFLVLLLIVVGAACGFVFYNYHVVQDEKGIHLLAKDKPGLNVEIVDTRDWNAGDWLKNSEISKGLAKLRWDDFKNEAQESWDKLSGSIEDAFEELKADDSWSDEVAEGWEDLKRSTKQKYEKLEESWRDGDLDREAFNRKMEELRKWAEDEVAELRKRLS